MSKPAKPYTVTNINKRGEVFDPRTYFVSRAENPELYAFLAQVKPNQANQKEKRS